METLQIVKCVSKKTIFHYAIKIIIHTLKEAQFQTDFFSQIHPNHPFILTTQIAKKLPSKTPSIESPFPLFFLIPHLFLIINQTIHYTQRTQKSLIVALLKPKPFTLKLSPQNYLGSSFEPKLVELTKSLKSPLTKTCSHPCRISHREN